MSQNQHLSDFIVAKIQEIAFVMVAPSDALIASGVLDSVNIVELAVEIERHTSTKIPFEEITAERFNTVETICTYIESLKA